MVKIKSDINGAWIPEDTCGCGETHYWAIEVRHDESLIVPSDLNFFWSKMWQQRLLNLIKPFGIDNITHDSVLVIYECSTCNSIFSKTYDIVGKQKKRARFGHFSKKITLKQIISEIHLPYSYIEQIYEEMFANYNVIIRNCKHWSDQMFKKITDKERLKKLL